MMLDLNTSAPKVFWKGQQVPVRSVMVIEARVHLKVVANPTLNAVYDDMVASGIRIKEVV